MIALLLVFLFIAVVLLEAPVLVRKKMWREFTAFSLYLLLAMALSFPLVLGVRIPKPGRFIEMVFAPLSELLR